VTPSFDKHTSRIRFSLRDVIVATASFFVCLGAAALVFASPQYLVAVSVNAGPGPATPIAANTPLGTASTEAHASSPDGAVGAAAAVPAAVQVLADASAQPAVVPTPTDPPAEEVAPAALPAYLYGQVVDPAGKPVRGATVAVMRYVNGVSERVVSLVSAADGTFSTTLAEPSGTYRIIASVDVGGKNVRGSTTLDPESGLSYGVRVTLIEKSYILFLPIPGY